MAILLCEKPAGGCMFVGIDHTFFFTVFLLCAVQIHGIFTCQSAYSGNLLFLSLSDGRNILEKKVLA